MSTTQLKIYYSGSHLTAHIDEREEDKIVKELTSGKGWTDLQQKSGKLLRINNSLVFAIEISHSGQKNTSNGSIPIKTLADIAGVHPITITRQFEDTLSKQGKLSRATFKTAKALIEHLKKKESLSHASEEAILKLFKK